MAVLHGNIEVCNFLLRCRSHIPYKLIFIFFYDEAHSGFEPWAMRRLYDTLLPGNKALRECSRAGRGPS